ncbi:MAG TPA: acyl carrier protein [Variovorax sp.]|nr:acyl carrier protein [Variovorax sp.]
MRPIASDLDVDGRVRAVLTRFGRLDVDVQTLSDDDNLNGAGMTSHATVDVMLALEDVFGEIPEALLTRSTFESIGAIKAALRSLGTA